MYHFLLAAQYQVRHVELNFLVVASDAVDISVCENDAVAALAFDVDIAAWHVACLCPCLEHSFVALLVVTDENHCFFAQRMNCLRSSYAYSCFDSWKDVGLNKWKFLDSGFLFVLFFAF